MKISENNQSELLELVQDIAFEAGEILLKFQKKRHHLEVIDKGLEGIASRADQESEDYIKDRLQNAFPKHEILSEESDYLDYERKVKNWQDKEFLWVIDPLDGTNNFVNGIPIFAISIALISKGETLLGLVYNPHSGECFFATKNQGAFLIDYRINPLRRYPLENKLNAKAPHECIFSPAPIYEIDHRFEQQLSAFKKNITGARAVRRLGCAALELCYVACGNFDAYWEKSLKPWDVAAGYLICSEAGIIVTDFSGQSYTPFNDSIIAAAQPLYGQIIGKIRS